jgi:WD40 repeat protein
LSRDSALDILDPETGKKLGQLAVSPFGSYALFFAPGGRTLASINVDGTVSLLAMPAGMEYRRTPAFAEKAWTLSFAFAPDGKAFAVGRPDGSVSLVEVATGHERLRLRGHQSRVSGVAFAPGGRLLASASHDGTILLWDLRLAGRQ